MVVNLQKQVQEKDDTLRDLNVKLSRKSEECDSLMEERDTMRSKNSFALQQVGFDMAIFSNYRAMATLKSCDKCKISRLPFQFEFDGQTETELATCEQADSTMTGADEQEPATPILSLCHGSFTDCSIFSRPFIL